MPLGSRANWLVPLLALLIALPAQARTVTDSLGREVALPDVANRVVCSGPGCLRLLVYLQAQDLVVGVDSLEARSDLGASRPYALACPQLAGLPVFGEARGFDQPERLTTLAPQVVFKTFPDMGRGAQLLQDKTGLPVIALKYGNLTRGRTDLDRTLLLMGEVLGKTERARAVIDYLDAVRRDLAERTRGVPSTGRPSCYVGGVAMRGGHGMQSTDPDYAPFAFVGALNAAAPARVAGTEPSHASVSREQLLAWDPDILFLDVATLQLGEAGGLHELRNDPVYAGLKAARGGHVHGLLPCNAYAQNFDSVLANAYFVGKLLYPDRFADVDPAAKADEIYAFLVGQPVFARQRAAYGELLFSRVPTR